MHERTPMGRNRKCDFPHINYVFNFVTKRWRFHWHVACSGDLIVLQRCMCLYEAAIKLTMKFSQWSAYTKDCCRSTRIIDVTNVETIIKTCFFVTNKKCYQTFQSYLICFTYLRIFCKFILHVDCRTRFKYIRIRRCPLSKLLLVCSIHLVKSKLYLG